MIKFLSNLFEYKIYQKGESVELPINADSISNETIQKMSKTLAQNTNGKYTYVKTENSISIRPTSR